MIHTPKRNSPEHKARMAAKAANRAALYSSRQGPPPAGWFPSAHLNRQGEPHARKREVDRRAQQETVRGG